LCIIPRFEFDLSAAGGGFTDDACRFLFRLLFAISACFFLFGKQFFASLFIATGGPPRKSNGDSYACPPLQALQLLRLSVESPYVLLVVMLLLVKAVSVHIPIKFTALAALTDESVYHRADGIIVKTTSHQIVG